MGLRWKMGRGKGPWLLTQAVPKPCDRLTACRFRIAPLVPAAAQNSPVSALGVCLPPPPYCLGDGCHFFPMISHQCSASAAFPSFLMPQGTCHSSRRGGDFLSSSRWVQQPAATAMLDPPCCPQPAVHPIWVSLCGEEGSRGTHSKRKRFIFLHHYVHHHPAIPGCLSSPFCAPRDRLGLAEGFGEAAWGEKCTS